MDAGFFCHGLFIVERPLGRPLSRLKSCVEGDVRAIDL